MLGVSCFTLPSVSCISSSDSGVFPSVAEMSVCMNCIPSVRLAPCSGKLLPMSVGIVCVSCPVSTSIACISSADFVVTVAVMVISLSINCIPCVWSACCSAKLSLVSIVLAGASCSISIISSVVIAVIAGTLYSRTLPFWSSSCWTISISTSC